MATMTTQRMGQKDLVQCRREYASVRTCFASTRAQVLEVSNDLFELRVRIQGLKGVLEGREDRRRYQEEHRLLLEKYEHLRKVYHGLLELGRKLRAEIHELEDSDEVLGLYEEYDGESYEVPVCLAHGGGPYRDWTDCPLTRAGHFRREGRRFPSKVEVRHDRILRGKRRLKVVLHEGGSTLPYLPRSVRRALIEASILDILENGPPDQVATMLNGQLHE